MFLDRGSVVLEPTNAVAVQEEPSAGAEPLPAGGAEAAWGWEGAVLPPSLHRWGRLLATPEGKIAQGMEFMEVGLQGTEQGREGQRKAQRRNEHKQRKTILFYLKSDI